MGRFEYGEGPGYEEHTGYHHCGCVNQGADRAGALHCIGQPDVEGELGRLAHGTEEQKQGDTGQCSLSDGPGTGGFKGVVYTEIEGGAVDVAHLTPQPQYANQQTHVSQAGSDEGFLCGLGSGTALVVEADEEVGAKANELPSNIEQ